MFGVCVTSFLALSDPAALLNSSAGGVNDILYRKSIYSVSSAINSP
jgi:hypothetical protein